MGAAARAIAAGLGEAAPWAIGGTAVGYSIGSSASDLVILGGLALGAYYMVTH